MMSPEEFKQVSNGYMAILLTAIQHTKLITHEASIDGVSVIVLGVDMGDTKTGHQSKPLAVFLNPELFEKLEVEGGFRWDPRMN